MNTVFCCGVPYEGKGSCIICGKYLAVARARAKGSRKNKKTISIIEKMQKEKEYKDSLWRKCLLFAVENAKRMDPDKLVACDSCGEEKRFITFQWVIGDKPQYDVMSPQYSEELMAHYGPFFGYKKLICGSCAGCYRVNSMPLTEYQRKEKSRRIAEKYRVLKAKIPEDLICPRCKQKRSPNPNAWTSKEWCRSCQRRINTEKREAARCRRFGIKDE